MNNKNKHFVKLKSKIHNYNNNLNNNEIINKSSFILNNSSNNSNLKIKNSFYSQISNHSKPKENNKKIGLFKLI